MNIFHRPKLSTNKEHQGIHLHQTYISDLNLHERVRRAAPTVGDAGLCTTVYQSTCKTIFQEREVEEDTIQCTTIREEICEEVDEKCVINCDPKCTTLPVKRCNTETNTVKKYTPETKCTKVPRKVCEPRVS